MQSIDIESLFNKKADPQWAFEGIRSTEQWTHGYHRYPAKFVPNLVKKLIEEHTISSDIVADLFAGCGTTLVEAKAHGRRSIGVDINPVAELITKAKINAIAPALLEQEFKNLTRNFKDYRVKPYKSIQKHDRIDYWFVPTNKYKIAFLYEQILLQPNQQIREFFLVALSHILKNCSKWLQSGTKPQIDPIKPVNDPFKIFRIHTKQMIKKNNAFYNHLTENKFIQTPCEIRLEDARETSIRGGTVGIIITSPPYVTSYEYADIHQLTAYWYDYITDLREFRKAFIGTFHSLNQKTKVKTPLAKATVKELEGKDKRTAKEVANYFNDMYAVAKEMRRVLKAEGHTCLVIGNTTLCDVKIKSAEVFAEMLVHLKFDIVDIIKRSIPNKLNPTIRDKSSGRFSKMTNKNSKLVYPEEYILIAKKGSNGKTTR